MLSGCGVGDRVTSVRQGLLFYVVNERMLMRGRVIGRTPAALNAVLAQNPQVSTLVFQEMQAAHDSDAVREMGYDIRTRGLATEVQSDSVLAGASVDLFIAGAARRMVAEAEIGVGGAASYARRLYLAQMLGSDAFYEFALRAAPAGGIHLLTQTEIERYGLLTEPIIRLE
ncbi:hypothetical protein C8N30_3243 [Sulfitobacter guttiformis]|uniref:Uncharacterized protein n=2 Tax=Sulfitobacter guttiformis TaxID=74349 RepID=A0A420DIU6_9RHOB|nr:hypothetical protein C8N30_3243 [Sulfitobacter guttiformis]